MLPVAFSAKKVVTGAAMAVLLMGLGSGPARAEFSPSKPIEVVIPAGTGGGADQIARLLSSLIQEQGLSPYPFVPVNKPGEALTYMTTEADPDYTVMVTLNSFYTTPIIHKDLNIDPLAFTPIGLMAMDTFLLWVPNTHPYDKITDLKSFAKAVKSSGGDWLMGGTGLGQEDSILTAMIESELGIEIAYKPFPGGGTVAENVVRENIDSSVNNPAEEIDYWHAKMSRPLAQFTEQRQGIFPDVPTAQEEDYDIVYYMQRSINGAPSMSAEAQQWYIDLFHKVFLSGKWQAHCESEGLKCDNWIAGADLAAFHKDNYARHERLIKRVGVEAITGEAN